MFDPYVNNCFLPLAKQNIPKYYRFNEKDFVQTKEIIYTDLDYFKTLKDQSIIIVGGGPSTNKWIQEGGTWKYDNIWSCGHFFLNPTMKHIPVDLAMLSLEVDLLRPELLEYVKKYKPYLGIEWNPDWVAKINILKKNFANSYLFAMHTRFYGKLGYVARLIIFGAVLGASKISFIGADGPNAIVRGNHSFQQGKFTLPSGLNRFNADRIFTEQYKEFYRYLKEHFPNTQYISLDKENKYHAAIC